jgi:hypothetical protein
MAKPLGPTFGNEVIAAGLGGLPFSWGDTDETISGRENLDVAQNATLDGVIAAHDPTKQIVSAPAPSTAVLFNHENRLRTFEGVPPITLGDFRQQNGL